MGLTRLSADLFAWAAGDEGNGQKHNTPACQQLLDAGIIMFTPCLLLFLALHACLRCIAPLNVCVSLLRFRVLKNSAEGVCVYNFCGVVVS